MSASTLTTGAKVLAKRLKNRRLPDVPVPQTKDPELARALEGVKEHLRMYEGDTGAPKERFVSIQELEDSGLITADIKNKFAFIAQVQGQDVVQPAGTAAATVRTTVINNTVAGGSGASALNDLTDVNASRVSRSFLQFNGSLWTDFDLFGTVNLWEVSQTFSEGILFPSGQAASWLNDAGDTSTEFMSFDALPSVGDAVGYSLTKLGSAFSTASTSLVTVTGLELTDLTVGDEYLLVSIPMLGAYISSATNHEFNLYDDGVLIPESDCVFEPRSVSETLGRTFFFSRKITNAGNITAKCRAIASQTTWVQDESLLFAINLTDLTTDYYVYDEDTTGFTDHDFVDTWKNTGVSATFGDGSKNWLVFVSVHMEADTGRQVRYQLNDGTNSIPLIGYTPQDSTDELTLGGIVMMEGPANATWTLQSMQIGTGVENGVSYSSICAIDLGGFGQSIFSMTDPNAVNLDLEQVVEAASDTTTATSTWLGIGVTQFTPGASSLTSPDLRYNVDAGSDVALRAERDQQSYGYASQLVQIGVSAEIPSSSVLEIEVYHLGGDATQDVDWSGVVFINPAGPSGTTESFTVGDAAFNTIIDGLTTNITSAATDIDGTLNVDGAAVFVSTLDVTGAVTGSNLNVTNWDLAYGWGDWSGEGFLTSVAVTDLDGGTDGELITWDAAGAAAVVAVGSVGEVLTSGGVGVAPTFQAAGGLDGTGAETITGGWEFSHATFGAALKVNRISTTAASAIAYSNTDGIKGYAGFDDAGDFTVYAPGFTELMSLTNAGILTTTTLNSSTLTAAAALTLNAASDRINFDVASTRIMDATATYVLFDVPILMKEAAAGIGNFAGYGQIWMKSDSPSTLKYQDDAGTDWDIVMVVTSTTAALAAIANAINTAALKVAGFMVFNTTTGLPVWAVGSANGSLWVDATGATAHTPV